MKKRTFAEIVLAALLLAGCSSTTAGGKKKSSEKKEEKSSEKEDSSSEVTTGVLDTTDASESPETEEDEEDSDEATEGDITADVITATQAASNQKYAPLLTIGTRVTGTMNENGVAWYAFKTESQTKVTYSVTAVNLNNEEDNSWVALNLIDENGDVVEDDASSNDYKAVARAEGQGVTLSYSELEPDTIYYLKFSADDHQASYSILLRASTQKEQSAYLSSQMNNVTDTDDLSENVGTNQVNASYMELNSEVDNDFKNHRYHWYSFRTISEPKANYIVRVIDTDSDCPYVNFRVVDDYGNVVEDDNSSNDYRQSAGNDGQAKNLSYSKLNPDTIYYIELWSEDTSINYTYNLKLSCDAAKKKEEKKTTFQVPFSLDETQVKFKPDSDEFADESAAKDAIKPVADKILKYPDNKILLAGTTATFGNQSAAEKLSSKRAEAVKKMLTDEFDVPASQLETVGLGYEKDPFERAADMDVSGNFIESEAKKNRRVVVLDADSDTAKKILGNEN